MYTHAYHVIYRCITKINIFACIPKINEHGKMMQTTEIENRRFVCFIDIPFISKMAACVELILPGTDGAPSGHHRQS